MPSRLDSPPVPIDPPTPAAEEPDTASAELDRLFKEHNDALLRFIAAKVGSSQEAGEIAQEAYVRLLSLDERQAVSHLRAFLFKTAANLAVDRLRQRTRRNFLVSSASVDFAIFEISPERHLGGVQAMRRLRLGLSELPKTCREAFLLMRLEGLSCEEVAERLQIQPRSVWRHVARALEYLRERVESDSGDQERVP
ncbi:RNA polymerase sigma factor [Steroidobacter sp.]|uniref:RNA polymerase sigma factor n=1 Tax=Steroidobacter sp. TaxID=1978227 RepID=UPI001A489B5F|nr:sigma-70 family RNA polymerase sigma factor [Steroidobacter sp.]MBL8267901.1 sigma-70 family RNA polymerase sigma factor [Steroidobacter sp.]